MIIEHQIVTDQDGHPVAAKIPWDRFEKLSEELEEAIAKTEKGREEGNWDAFTDLDTLRQEFAEADARG